MMANGSMPYHVNTKTKCPKCGNYDYHNSMSVFMGVAYCSICRDNTQVVPYECKCGGLFRVNKKSVTCRTCKKNISFVHCEGDK